MTTTTRRMWSSRHEAAHQKARQNLQSAWDALSDLLEAGLGESEAELVKRSAETIEAVSRELSDSRSSR